ncbi:hypothetical protein [Piscinibacter gummiphilus]|uniref:Uncharacterized protein n=1 Tax=Piscinibacter gummiphilus TaxID=946333 RepID=A0A1W6LA90_9BURK|nr:hypothetical protein [Piscinibacter gummiphilus]ARN21215.1 hypothetical protein A4W93_15660 [Piscinibacter gummiphilus]ATU65898.1 hypothetical protein CPZ87_15740 [Piscinibacter gummiphilus]GLS93777.1 hypothetical protein GCM10007918_10680 [Piscinibacter gummiphilus]
MSRLASQKQRLYGAGRALVLSLGRPADWELVAAVWQGVQLDLDLPAPAIAVSGTDAYQLWFFLASPVSEADGLAFLDALRQRYWADVKPARVSAFAGDALPVVPAVVDAEGNWSAFVARDLAPVFADTPWLDIPPNEDGQADLLQGLAAITPEAWSEAWATLSPVEVPAPATAPAGTAAPAGTTTDPREFLLRVMNDPAAPLALRIEAAKALLPAR